jgi:hypothetical protein
MGARRVATRSVAEALLFDIVAAWSAPHLTKRCSERLPAVDQG